MKGVQRAIAPPLLVVRVVQMRQEKMAATHQADTAGIELFVALDARKPRQLGDKLYQARILPRENGLLYQRIAPIQLRGDELPLTNRVSEHHRRRQGKSVVDRPRNIGRKQVVDDKIVRRVLRVARSYSILFREQPLNDETGNRGSAGNIHSSQPNTD